MLTLGCEHVIRTLLDVSQSPELLAILADIQLAQDRASYARMTQSTTAGRSVLFPSMDPSSHHDGVWTGSSNDANTAGDWKEIRRQITAIVNVIASMATVATGVWWVGGGRSVGAVSSRRSIRVQLLECR
jgi:hypothetical protein